MKKLFYGAALMFAYKLLGEEISTVDYVWITKNQLKESEADAKEALEAIGISKDAIKVTSVPALNSDCDK